MPEPKPPQGPPTSSDASGRPDKAEPQPARPPSGPPTSTDRGAAMPKRKAADPGDADRPPGDPPLEREAGGRGGGAAAQRDRAPSGPPTETSAPGRGRGRDAEPQDAPPGDPPTGGSRMRGGVVTKVSVGSSAGGLEGLMAFPPVSRGSGPPEPPLDDHEEDAAPPEPPPLPLVEEDARLGPDQAQGPGGARRERIRERPVDRIDFRYQRYERLRVTEAVYRCPVRPDLEVAGVKAAWPRFVAGRLALGNGYAARLVEATFGDGAPLAESARSLTVVGPSLKPGHLGRVLDAAAEAVAPVMGALLAGLTKGKAKPRVDTGVGASWLEGRRTRAGTAHLVTDDAHHLVVLTREGADVEPDTAALLERAKEGDGDSLRWGMDASGRSRRGQWGVLRRRLALALPWQPQEAGMGLHRALRVQQAWTADPDPAALGEACDALRAWLEAHRSATPATHVARAATFGAESWDKLRPLDGRGRLRKEAAPDIKAPPVVWRPPAEVAIETARTWASLVAGCHALGLRPWTYIDAVLHAALHEGVGDGSGWTPAAWAKGR